MFQLISSLLKAEKNNVGESRTKPIASSCLEAADRSMAKEVMKPIVVRHADPASLRI